MTDFDQARIDMIEGQIRTSGVVNLNVLDALHRVPREAFLAESQADFAYLDKEHRLDGDAGRQMATPAATAKLIELADVSQHDIVLDIACGSGYSTAVLAHLSDSVVALETSQSLVEKANQVLSDLDISNAAVVVGPLANGVPSEAPFDVIIIEGAVEEVPKTLFDQLRDGGRLAAIVGVGNSAVAVLHVKNASGITRIRSFNASLPPLMAFAKKVEFAF